MDLVKEWGAKVTQEIWKNFCLFFVRAAVHVLVFFQDVLEDWFSQLTKCVDTIFRFNESEKEVFHHRRDALEKMMQVEGFVMVLVISILQHMARQ